MSHWPPRDAICIDCRTVLTVNSPCPAGAEHRVRSLHEPDGREALLHEVWGPKPFRDSVKRAARAGSAGGGFSLLDACGGCDILDVGTGIGEIIAVALLVAVVVGLVVLLGGAIAVAIRAWRRKPQPRGARRGGATVGRATGRVGVIVGIAGAPDPVTGVVGVGYAFELIHRRGLLGRRHTMLRDAATLGFEVALDSGERVRIPPGPCVVDTSAARRVRPRGDRVDCYRQELDPQRATTEDLEPFPYQEVRHVALSSGDRVEVLGPLIALPTGTATHTGGYRDAAQTVLVPAEIPRVRFAPVATRGAV